MSFDGVMRDGKVVFDGPAPLPDGTPVRVEPVAAPRPDPPAGPIPPLSERLKNVRGKAVGLPEDLSVNLDHYLYGLPKQQP